MARKRTDKLKPLTKRQQRMLADNMPLVMYVYRRVLRYVGKQGKQPGAAVLDGMYTAGIFGLVRAVQLYDPRRAAFSTYGYWAIRHQMVQFLGAKHQRGESRLRAPFNLEERKYHGTHNGELDALFERERLHTALSKLARRDRQAAAVIRMRFGVQLHRLRNLPAPSMGKRNGKYFYTLEQVGQKMGVTRERVRQIEVRGLQQLRVFLGNESD